VSLCFDAAAASEIGRRYRDNLDVAHVSTQPLLAVVADGMGDGPGSTMAGRTTVDLLVDRLGASSGLADIRDAVATAQQRVGDSRLYRLRANLLEILREVDDPQAAASDLVGAANAAGGHDNATAVVVIVSG